MKKQKYTIVELLAVIAIVAIVLGVGIPGINNLINGNKTERAAKQLATAISKARSTAAVSNCKVLLLLPVRQSSNKVSSEYLHRAYAIVVLDKDDKFNKDKNNNELKWEKLPANTVFTVTEDWEKDEFFAADGDPTSANAAVLTDLINFAEDSAFPDDIANTVKADIKKSFKSAFQKSTADGDCDVNYLMFNPDGTVAKKICFYFVEAFVDSNGKLLTREINEKASDDLKKKPAGAIGFKVNTFTGRVKYESFE